MTKELEKQFPKLYETEKESLPEKTVIAKYFHPLSNWTLYTIEYDPEERLFFGLTVADYTEWGYVSLDEMEEVTGPLGLHVERDLYFGQPKIMDIPELKEYVAYFEKEEVLNAI
jgi:hypothetical protein